jgi:hypothetical protein
MRQNVYISAQEFSVRFKSKRECYRFINVEGIAFLSPNHVFTCYFLQDFISGKKKVLLFILILITVLVHLLATR